MAVGTTSSPRTRPQSASLWFDVSRILLDSYRAVLSSREVLRGHPGYAWASTDFFRSASRSSGSDPNDLTAGGVLKQQVELAR